MPKAQGQPRRPDLSEGSVAPDSGRPQVVAPGSTRTVGRPWVDPRSVVRSAIKVAALQSTELTGRLLVAFQKAAVVLGVFRVRPEVDIPQLSAVVAPGSTSLVVCWSHESKKRQDLFFCFLPPSSSPQLGKPL